MIHFCCHIFVANFFRVSWCKLQGSSRNSQEYKKQIRIWAYLSLQVQMHFHASNFLSPDLGVVHGGYLYSKVDIMLEYKNTEKGCFFMEARIVRAVFKVSKTSKIKKKGMGF